MENSKKKRGGLSITLMLFVLGIFLLNAAIHACRQLSLQSAITQPASPSGHTTNTSTTGAHTVLAKSKNASTLQHTTALAKSKNASTLHIALTMTKNTSIHNALAKTKNSPLPICLQGFYGRNSNRIVALAKVIYQARLDGTKVALHKDFSGWYNKFFDPHDSIILHQEHLELNHTCSKIYRGKEAFRLHAPPSFVPGLITLVPKLEYRQQADKIIGETMKHPFISVHRRWLEGACYTRAERFGTPTCNSSLITKSCNMVEKDIPNPNGLDIWLFTDGQRPLYDSTFTNIVNRKGSPFAVQMWMMTQSVVHYGTTLSTVDWVVNGWREGKGMHPAICFPKLD